MLRKVIIQLIILAIIMILAFFFYNSLKKEKISINENFKIDEINTNKLSDEKSNLLENIEYSSEDRRGNKYKIKSRYGKIDFKKPEEIFMTEVYATIILTNNEIIEVFSDYAIYNNITFDTLFEKNVLTIYLENEINSEKLTISFKDNLATFTENVKYKNKTTNLFADAIEINLISKKTRIFMEDNSEKIIGNVK